MLGLFMPILGFLLIVLLYSSLPMLLLVFCEIISKKINSIFVFKIFNILQFIFPFIVLAIAYSLYFEYKPALFLGLSQIFVIISLLLLLLINIEQINIIPLTLIKIYIQSIFFSLFAMGIVSWQSYHPPRDNGFPTVIGSFFSPIVIYIASAVCVLFLLKHKAKHWISAIIAIFGFMLTYVSILLEKESFVWFDPIFNNHIIVHYKLLLVILIPIFLLVLSIFVYKNTKARTSVWLIIGSSVLVIAFLMSILYYNKYYEYESLVANIISQGEFILIGIFESLYLLAFAFMGLGLLGFKKMPMQLENENQIGR